MLYHATTRDRVESILVSGLTPQGETRAVYVGSSMGSVVSAPVMDARLEQHGSLYIFEIDERVLKTALDPVYASAQNPHGEQVYRCYDVIPPQAFQDLWRYDGKQFQNSGPAATAQLP